MYYTDKLKESSQRKQKLNFNIIFPSKTLVICHWSQKQQDNEMFLVFLRFTLIATVDICQQVCKIYDLQQIYICKLGVEPISS